MLFKIFLEDRSGQRWSIERLSGSTPIYHVHLGPETIQAQLSELATLIPAIEAQSHEPPTFILVPV
jgi:hypothetical protein